MNRIVISHEVHQAILSRATGPMKTDPRVLLNGDVEIEVDDDVLEAIALLDPEPDTALRISFKLPPRGA